MPGIYYIIVSSKKDPFPMIIFATFTINDTTFSAQMFKFLLKRFFSLWYFWFH